MASSLPIIRGGKLLPGYTYSSVCFDRHIGMSPNDAIRDPVTIDLVIPPEARSCSVTYEPHDSTAIEILSARCKFKWLGGEIIGHFLLDSNLEVRVRVISE